MLHSSIYITIAYARAFVHSYVRMFEYIYIDGEKEKERVRDERR